MSKKYLTNLDLNGNVLQNPVLNPLATPPEHANPYYVYQSTASADKGTCYVNVGTYQTPVWQPLGHEPIAGDGITVDGYEVNLNQVFYDYLVEKTFNQPVLTLSITGLGGSAEIGSSVSVSGFTHSETYPENINGSLTLKHGTTTIASNITPSSTSASGSFTARSVTRNTAGSETFTLSGTDTLGHAVTKSVSKTFYVPKLYGTDTDATVTDTELLAMTHVQSYGTLTINVPANSYVYFAQDSAISQVKNADTGFGVALTDLGTMTLSINGVSKTYYVYRTDKLQAQTLRVTVS